MSEGVVDGVTNDAIAKCRHAEERREEPRPTLDRVDDGDVDVTVACRPDDQPSENDEHGRSSQQLRRPTSTQESSLLGVVDDEGTEPPPPCTLDVNREKSHGNRPVGGEPRHHVLQYEALMGAERLALVGAVAAGRTRPKSSSSSAGGSRRSQPRAARSITVARKPDAVNVASLVSMLTTAGDSLRSSPW